MGRATSPSQPSPRTELILCGVSVICLSDTGRPGRRDDRYETHQGQGLQDPAICSPNYRRRPGLETERLQLSNCGPKDFQLSPALPKGHDWLLDWYLETAPGQVPVSGGGSADPTGVRGRPLQQQHGQVQQLSHQLDPAPKENGQNIPYSFS